MVFKRLREWRRKIAAESKKPHRGIMATDFEGNLTKEPIRWPPVVAFWTSRKGIMTVNLRIGKGAVDYNKEKGVKNLAGELVRIAQEQGFEKIILKTDLGLGYFSDHGFKIKEFAEKKVNPPGSLRGFIESYAIFGPRVKFTHELNLKKTHTGD